MITVLHEQRVTPAPEAEADGERLWMTRADLHTTTGWEWKPEGLCQGDVCVPLPAGQVASLVRGEHLDASTMWRHMGHPVAHDEAGTTWVLGTGEAQRASALSSLDAPDFELPDLDGRPHRLSDYRGRRVFLATWASW